MVSGNGMVARPMEAHCLLGIAIVACLALAACGTASGQTGTAAGVATTTPATSSSATATSGGMAGPGSGQAAQGSGQAAQGLGQAGNGPAQAVPGAAATRPKPRALALPATARPGDHGKGVAALQRQLATLGYEVRKVDGQYGSATQHAVVAFQKVNHLTRDGIAGPKTMKAPAQPRARPPRVGERLHGLGPGDAVTAQVVHLLERHHGVLGRRPVLAVDLADLVAEGGELPLERGDALAVVTGTGRGGQRQRPRLGPRGRRAGHRLGGPVARLAQPLGRLAGPLGRLARSRPGHAARGGGGGAAGGWSGGGGGGGGGGGDAGRGARLTGRRAARGQRQAGDDRDAEQTSALPWVAPPCHSRSPSLSSSV